jgi:hypothetical protein
MENRRRRQPPRKAARSESLFYGIRVNKRGEVVAISPHRTSVLEVLGDLGQFSLALGNGIAKIQRPPLSSIVLGAFDDHACVGWPSPTDQALH